MKPPKVQEGMPHLILSRREGQFLWIGDTIRVSVQEFGHDDKGRPYVRLGVQAPREELILRGPELIDENGVHTRKDS